MNGDDVCLSFTVVLTVVIISIVLGLIACGFLEPLVFEKRKIE